MLRICASKLALLGIFIGCLLVTVAAAAQQSVPASRLGRLQHGINLGRFKDGAIDNPGVSTCSNTDPRSCSYSIANVKALNLDHVRVLLEPGQMFDSVAPGGLNAQSPSLAALDVLVNECLQQQIGIILALSLDEPRMQKRLGKESDFLRSLENFWNRLANHYSSPAYSEYVFFEVLNEPGLDEPDLTFDQWSGPKPPPEGGIQAALVHAIRNGAPQSTILAAGAEKADINGLLALTPFTDDADVVYVFHYYEPYSFTHQGENWDKTSYAYHLDGVRYPYEAAAARQAAAEVKTTLPDKMNAWHDMETATKDRIETDFEIVAEWSGKNGHAPVTCDEFGVQRRHEDPEKPGHGVGAEPADRAQWVRDVVQLLKAKGIGWTFWDYSSVSFGLVPDVPSGDVTRVLNLNAISGKH